MGVMPLYQTSDEPKKTLTSHKGLWFERFFNKYDRQWRILEGDKKVWIESATGGSCGNAAALTAATSQQRQLCSTLAGVSKAFQAEWHFSTGLGNAHPVENGFTWHPTLGTPYLSGASVKGLIRAYIEEWAGLDDKAQIREICRFWFGSESKSLGEQNKYDPSQAGAYVFFDAIPLAPVKLTCDIMTPHMKNWYSKGDKITNVIRDADAVPADWHNPVPIPFLVVKDGSFLFCIAPRQVSDKKNMERAKEQLPKVMEALANALEYMGAGAKTAVGYGRMMSDDLINNAIVKKQVEEALAEMLPEERYRAELCDMDEKKIAEMFGKDFNKTQKTAGENWGLQLSALRLEKSELVRSWESADKKSAQGKAYKKLKDII